VARDAIRKVKEHQIGLQDVITLRRQVSEEMMDEKKAKTKVLKILSQAAGERAAGNEEAARNMEEQAAELQKQHNLPEANDDAVRRRVEAAWAKIPTDAQVYIRVPDPKAPSGVTTIQVTMKKALPMLLEEKATYAGLADVKKSKIFWW